MKGNGMVGHGMELVAFFFFTLYSLLFFTFILCILKPFSLLFSMHFITYPLLSSLLSPYSFFSLYFTVSIITGMS